MACTVDNLNLDNKRNGLGSFVSINCSSSLSSIGSISGSSGFISNVSINDSSRISFGSSIGFGGLKIGISNSSNSLSINSSNGFSSVNHIGKCCSSSIFGVNAGTDDTSGLGNIGNISSLDGFGNLCGLASTISANGISVLGSSYRFSTVNGNGLDFKLYLVLA